jgi:hypothetical protein
MANPSIDTIYSWGALATGISTDLQSQTAILSMNTNFNCSIEARYYFYLKVYIWPN